ncbi:anthranilate synthase component I, partial [Burkholderia multivorans]
GIDDPSASGFARIEAMLARITAPAPAEVRVPEAVTPQVRTRTPRETYLEGVRRAKQDIVDGEIFQVVLGQRFDTDCDAEALMVYRMLRRANPSPFMYLLDLHDSDGQPVS